MARADGVHWRAGSAGVDLLLPEWERRLAETPREVPHCAHGPLLLFRRWYAGGKSRVFWACSASRGRARGAPSAGGGADAAIASGAGADECPAFCWDDRRRFSPADDVHPPWREYNPAVAAVAGRGERGSIADRFCVDCQLPVSPRGQAADAAAAPAPTAVSAAGHDATHRVVACAGGVARPTELLRPLDADTRNAQYFFSPSAVAWAVGQLERLGAANVVCVGTPRIHEAWRARRPAGAPAKPSGAGGGGGSLLLDLDHRFAWFYPPREFARFNMATFHFLDAPDGVAPRAVAAFLARADAVVVDPPFGLDPAALARMLRLLHSVAGRELPTLLFFPYFLRKAVAGALPWLRMSDYAVSYANHATYHDRKGKRGSPVRVYSNVAGRDLVLPASEGYTWCGPCDRWVAAANRHCDACGACTSLDGRRWAHCDRCGVCVKPVRAHCDMCGRCQPPGHDCHAPALSSGRCHVCGSADHKRSWHDDPRNAAASAGRGGGGGGAGVDSLERPKRRRTAASTDGWHVNVVRGVLPSAASLPPPPWRRLRQPLLWPYAAPWPRSHSSLPPPRLLRAFSAETVLL